MANRARLIPPRPERNSWPWHHAKWASMSAATLMAGDRRMEAENYLAGGYGIRLALEARQTGWVRFGEVAQIWQPNRLKGIQVSPQFGTPFLAATQVFDLRPVARKWLSLDRTGNAANRFVSSGMILVTCSGSVGRATMAHKPHEGMLISHDLLRVEAVRPEETGWIYAFLRSQQGRAMMTAAQYGHIIKHLEVAHMNALPFPVLRDGLRKYFSDKFQKILDSRSAAFAGTVEAEKIYADQFPSARNEPVTENGFSVGSSELLSSRRRLDASSYAPAVRSTIEAFKRHAVDIVALSSVADGVFVPGRFKHVYGDGGTPYLDSADILEVNPDVKKYVLSLSHEEQEEYRVEENWILIPCSGQVYGNIGHAVLSTEWHQGKVLSNHIMRVCPSGSIRPGYLQCALGHPRLGRPQLVRFAFGSSVPEISPDDVLGAVIPRLEDSVECRIADLMEESARSRDSADELEQAIAKEAEELIDQFLAGDLSSFAAGV